jgi:uncharacterized protein with beta-barrel porin domain
MSVSSRNTPSSLPPTSLDVQPQGSATRRPGPSPWITAFALPVVVPLGVILPGIGMALPGSAYAQTSLTGIYSNTVSLANYGTGNPFTITAGAIISAPLGSNGVSGANGTVWALTNLGTIRGDTGVVLGSGTISNSGSITGTAQYGVALGSGSVTNMGGATITGNQDGIQASGTDTVFNHGAIQGTGAGSSGVLLLGGGSVSNLGSSATISGVTNGVKAGLGLGGNTVTNEGTISSLGGFGVYLGAAGGSVTNSVTSARIQGVAAGIYSRGATTVINSGLIDGSSSLGIKLAAAGGSVSNQGTSSVIEGVAGGVLIGGGAGTVVNYGAIDGVTAYGVSLTNGGTVTTGTSSTIRGGSSGLLVTGAAATVVNAGTISGVSATGVNLGVGGTIENHGVISGVTAGVEVSGGTATITNMGTIVGQSVNGGTGVLFTGTGQGTIDNFGVIIGLGGTAVKFAGGTNLLIIESGGLLAGIADGSNGINTLEFRGTGALSGAQVSGFESVEFTGTSTVDSQTSVTNASISSGASLVNQGTLNGTFVVAGGGTVNNAGMIATQAASSNSGTLTNAGTISNTSAFANHGLLTSSGRIIGIGTLTNDGIFTNTGTVDTPDGLGNSGTFTNSGQVSGITAGVTGSGMIVNSGTIVATTGTGVYLSGPGVITNASTGLIKGGQYGIQVGAGGMVTNAGTILDDAIAGASLGSGATVGNTASGTIGGVTGAMFVGTGATLNNTGTITGTGGVAVQFDAGVNNLNLGTGSVLNGSIDGGGGAGQIALTGTGTLSNPVSNFGAGSALSIASGASWTASGNWTTASVANAGSFQAGTLSSPLHLTGNFTQGAGATLQVALDGGGAHSQFAIDGTATLGGTLGVVSSGTLMMAGTSYTVLSASGGVIGTFGSATIGNALLTPNVTYDASNVVVTLGQLPVVSATSVAGTPNQRATAVALDRALALSPAAFAATLTGLDQLSGPQVRASLDRLSGESHASLPTVALMAGEQFVNQFRQQSGLARLGDNGAAAGEGLGGADGRQQLASLESAPVANPWANLSLPWGIWTSGYGQTGHLDGDGNTHGLSESIAGAAVGVDYKVDPALRLGVAVGYGFSSYSLDDGGGDGHVNYTQVGAYGGYTRGPAYLDGMIGVAFGDGRTSRDASLPGSAGDAQANVSSTQLLGGLEAGYRLPLGNVLTLTPFAGLSFGTVWQNSFSENGAGARDLDVQDQTQSSVKSTLGARLSADVPVSRWLVATSVQVGWAHEFAPTDRDTTAVFAGAPSVAFTVAGAKVPANSAMVAVGVTTRLSARGSLYLNYDGYFSGSGSSNAVTGGFRYVW